ncbi:MAG: cytochrome c [Caulobacteraceae bacterium]|jgi:cytochrome c6|nr:cytochrome c [Caulobacteraceae bacterium]
MGVRVLVTAGALIGALATAGSALAQDGAAQFAQNCAACHQPMGQGVPGAFPALAGNKFVQGDPKGPAYVVTHGRGGMPNFSEDLSDAQVATILSYVRSSWGNTAAPLDAATVAAVRGAPAPPDTQAGLPFH